MKSKNKINQDKASTYQDSESICEPYFIYPSDDEIQRISEMSLDEVKAELDSMGLSKIPLPTFSSIYDEKKPSLIHKEVNKTKPVFNWIEYLLSKCFDSIRLACFGKNLLIPVRLKTIFSLILTGIIITTNTPLPNLLNLSNWNDYQQDKSSQDGRLYQASIETSEISRYIPTVSNTSSINPKRVYNYKYTKSIDKKLVDNKYIPKRKEIPPSVPTVEKLEENIPNFSKNVNPNETALYLSKKFEIMKENKKNRDDFYSKQTNAEKPLSEKTEILPYSAKANKILPLNYEQKVGGTLE